MGKLKTGTCPECGKEFSFYPSAYGGKDKVHCSRACQSKASRIDTTCPQCGKKFWYHQSWPRIYCSLKCSAAVNGIKNLGVVELAPIFCEVCGQEIKQNRWHGRRFCSQSCFGTYLSETQTGIPRPEVAGERPDQQNRVTLNCKQCGKPFQVKKSQAKRRRFCSRDCQARWRRESGAYSGENNWNWKGGPEPYYGPNWRPQRRNARRRDRYTCQRCGITEDELGRQLDVHHIIPFREFGIDQYKEANRLKNLISLCNTCHLIIGHGH